MSKHPIGSPDSHCCCFTGHRPEKLGADEDTVRFLTRRIVLRAADSGFNVFISGMARGVDLWAADVVLALRDEGYDLSLVCASPFEGFEKSWKSEWRDMYRRILAAADEVFYICPGYDRGCFRKRNEWMVDRSERVIAFYNGEPGGTANTIRYATKKGVRTYNAFDFLPKKK